LRRQETSCAELAKAETGCFGVVEAFRNSMLCVLQLPQQPCCTPGCSLLCLTHCRLQRLEELKRSQEELAQHSVMVL
jgi:hypothetical protein